MISSQRTPPWFPLCGTQSICTTESTKRRIKRFQLSANIAYKEIRPRPQEKNLQARWILPTKHAMESCSRIRVVSTFQLWFDFDECGKHLFKGFLKSLGLWSCRELLWWSSTTSDFYFTGEKVTMTTRQFACQKNFFLETSSIFFCLRKNRKYIFCLLNGLSSLLVYSYCTLQWVTTSECIYLQYVLKSPRI